MSDSKHTGDINLLLELAQALGVTEEQALRLVRYVFGRPTGDIRSELRGSLFTLASVAEVTGHNLEEVADEGMADAIARSPAIKEKWYTKPL